MGWYYASRPRPFIFARDYCRFSSIGLPDRGKVVLNYFALYAQRYFSKLKRIAAHRARINNARAQWEERTRKVRTEANSHRTPREEKMNSRIKLWTVLEGKKKRRAASQLIMEFRKMWGKKKWKKYAVARTCETVLLAAVTSFRFQVYSFSLFSNAA